MSKQKKKPTIKLFVLPSFLLFILISILFLKSPLFQVELSTPQSLLEAGTKPETNPDFYLDGSDWSVPLSYIDTSSVRYTKVGRYPVHIYHGFQKYTSYINVIDTTAPVVTCEVDTKTIVPGEVVSLKSLGLDIKDFSEIDSSKFTKISSSKFHTNLPEADTKEMQEAYRKGISIEAEDFQFAYGGIYSLTICVSDIFHNTSDMILTIKVEEPPVIEAPEDFYVADNKEVDFLQYIKVWDFISEELNRSDVKVDRSKLNLSKAGTYPVIFSATDDYGLTTTKSVNVHVCSVFELQELINSHTISIENQAIIGAPNPHDNGYYTSANTDLIQQMVLPSIVNIKNNSLDRHGRGFIVEINDKFVTLATSEHIINGDLIIDVTFYDTTLCSGAVVAADSDRGIAFIRIPIGEINTISSLSYDYVKKLRTVHINKGDWDKHINDNESILSIATNTIASGCPLFDDCGRLVGMACETVNVPLPELLEYFELIFKYKIHYQ